MPDTLSAPPGMSDERRHQETESSSWMVGVVLILLGIAFFAQNAGYTVLAGNWWAVFIYLAAFASLANAWRSYNAKGEFGTTASASLTWGLVLLVVASIFMFNLMWDIWWPAILVAVGVGIVTGSVLGARTKGRGNRDVAGQR